MPGIDTTRVESIFEEHVLLSQLDPHSKGNKVFVLREKLFSFGSVLADLA